MRLDEMVARDMARSRKGPGPQTIPRDTALSSTFSRESLMGHAAAAMDYLTSAIAVRNAARQAGMDEHAYQEYLDRASRETDALRDSLDRLAGRFDQAYPREGIALGDIYSESRLIHDQLRDAIKNARGMNTQTRDPDQT